MHEWYIVMVMHRAHLGPRGVTWLEVKGLALRGQLIEIDMEARIRR
jgi:hypothetical protein